MACVSSSNNSSMATTSSKIMAAARTPFGSPPPKSKLPPFWNSNAHAEKTQITACLKESQQGDVENQQALPVMATSVPSLSFSKTAASMKSPITSCFERMLGAGTRNIYRNIFACGFWWSQCGGILVASTYNCRYW